METYNPKTIEPLTPNRTTNTKHKHQKQYS